MKFKNYVNFEKKLYPKLIKKFKCNFVSFKGFWHSIDNTKDVEVLKKINNLNKFNEYFILYKKYVVNPVANPSNIKPKIKSLKIL